MRKPTFDPSTITGRLLGAAFALCGLVALALLQLPQPQTSSARVAGHKTKLPGTAEMQPRRPERTERWSVSFYLIGQRTFGQFTVCRTREDIDLLVRTDMLEPEEKFSRIFTETIRKGRCANIRAAARVTRLIGRYLEHGGRPNWVVEIEVRRNDGVWDMLYGILLSPVVTPPTL